jgi:pyruvate,orthophosphate dikinase
MNFFLKLKKKLMMLQLLLGLPLKEIESRINELHEQNPMLGHRGCRLGISFPEIYEMQCRAIFEALSELKKKKLNQHFLKL